MPRAMGRATRIRKRTAHLTITLTPTSNLFAAGHRIRPVTALSELLRCDALLRQLGLDVCGRRSGARIA